MQEMYGSPVPPEPTTSAAVKRYEPPNQRNRPLSNNRRKSGDRLDRANSLHSSDGSGNLGNGIYRSGLIALEGCSRSDAAQLLNDRWERVKEAHNNKSIGQAERPIFYSGGSSGLSNSKVRLPHQLMQPKMDFMGKLQAAIDKANAYSGD